MLTGVRDVDMQILNLLDDSDLVNACQIDIAAKGICNDQIFWFNRILIKFPEIPIDVLHIYRGNRSWSDYYTQDLIAQARGCGTIVNAARNGRLDQVMIAVNRIVDVPGNTGAEIALQWASTNGHLDIVRYLVERGVDLHSEFDYAIRWASRNGHLDVVRYLVENEANIHVMSDNALRLARDRGHLDVVNYLKSLP